MLFVAVRVCAVSVEIDKKNLVSLLLHHCNHNCRHHCVNIFFVIIIITKNCSGTQSPLQLLERGEKFSLQYSTIIILNVT